MSLFSVPSHHGHAVGRIDMFLPRVGVLMPTVGFTNHSVDDDSIHPVAEIRVYSNSNYGSDTMLTNPGHDMVHAALDDGHPQDDKPTDAPLLLPDSILLTSEEDPPLSRPGT